MKNQTSDNAQNTQEGKVTEGTKFSSNLNEFYNYQIKKVSEDKFYYSPIDKETGKELNIEITEYKDLALISLRHGTYSIIS